LIASGSHMKKDPEPPKWSEYVRWTRAIFACGTQRQLDGVEATIEAETAGELREKLRRLVSARRDMLVNPR
jgi:hypothetical protein